tara:strand:+ start:764 stop:1192 length:429 start_codon:yes stop_codon:yes gene_type:complete
MYNDLEIDEVLLLIENKIYIHSSNNIVYIELLEDSLTDGDNIIMHKVLDNFYNNCKKNNTIFYIVYDFSQLSITSSTNLIYNASIYQDHFDKHITFLRTNLKYLYIIIQNYTLRESLNNILDLYKPEIQPKIIKDIKDIEFY